MSPDNVLRDLPPSAGVFHRFARLLRDEGFGVVTQQTVAFMQGVALVGPKSIGDIYWTARATLAPPIERAEEFDALFDAFFRDAVGVAAIARSMPEEDAPARESDGGPLESETSDEANESGEAASAAEALSLKVLAPKPAEKRLRDMQRSLGAAMPTRRGFRRIGARRGDRPDLRKSLSRFVHGEAAAIRPAWTRRRESPRRVLLLIDISGSMKANTDENLRFAHALTAALPAVETFSFGTRLTRLTRALRHKNLDRALAEIAPAVADWDGGTRIADNFRELLTTPRFSRASRGALTIVLSDGLERGDPKAMAAEVRRLAARSWRMAWLTPLAADPGFRPETQALKLILPMIDHLGDGGSIASIAGFVEASRRLGKVAPAAGRSGARAA
jgi:uncharacterized protein